MAHIAAGDASFGHLPSRTALAHVASTERASLQARLSPNGALGNASLISAAASASVGRAVHRLLAGQTVRLYVVGGSAAAGAGGAGLG